MFIWSFSAQTLKSLPRPLTCQHKLLHILAWLSAHSAVLWGVPSPHGRPVWRRACPYLGVLHIPALYSGSHGWGRPLYSGCHGWSRPLYSGSHGWGRPLYSGSHGWGRPLYSGCHGWGRPLYSGTHVWGRPLGSGTPEVSRQSFLEVCLHRAWPRDPPNRWQILQRCWKHCSDDF